MSQNKKVQQLKATYETIFNKRQLPVEDVVYQCCLDAGDSYYLDIKDGALECKIGYHDAPTLTLYFPDIRTPLHIADGSLDPMTAFLRGDFRADGHLMLVMQYLMLFGPLSRHADLR